MSLDFTRAKARPKLKRWQLWFLGIGLTLSAVVFYLLSATTIVLNGTSSLPHSGYFMVTWPQILRPGIYVAFEAPDEIAAAFDDLVFVKRVAAMPGDEVLSSPSRVCVNGECRDLLPEMIDAGYLPLHSHVVPPGKVVAFGEAVDSLDSRYAAIGDVDASTIVAVGYPIRIPHWKEIGAWLGTF